MGACGDGQPRHVGEDDGRGHRQAGADPEQARVYRDVERAHREARGVAADDGDERPREQHAQNGAAAAEDQALGEQRSPQRARARAERRAHGQLPFAPDGAREDQVGDVRARDREDDACRGEQQEQDRPRRRGDLIAQPRDAQLHVGARRVGLGMLAASSRRAPRSAPRAPSSTVAPGASRPKSSVMRCVRLVTIVAPR